jgi:hypothetical protein
MFKSKNIEPNDFHNRIMDKLSNDKREALAQKSKFVYSHFFDIVLKNDEKFLRKNVIDNDAIIKLIYTHLADRLLENSAGTAFLNGKTYHNCDVDFLFWAAKIAKLGAQDRQEDIARIFDDPASTIEIKELCIAQMKDFERLSSILERYSSHYLKVAVLLNLNFLSGPKEEVDRILKDMTSGPRKTQAFYVQMALASLYLDMDPLGELIEDQAVELQAEILYHTYNYEVIKWLSENSRTPEIKFVAKSKLSRMRNMLRKYGDD